MSYLSFSDVYDNRVETFLLSLAKEVAIDSDNLIDENGIGIDNANPHPEVEPHGQDHTADGHGWKLLLSDHPHCCFQQD